MKTIVSALVSLTLLSAAADAAESLFRSPRISDATYDYGFKPYEPRNSTFPTTAEERGLSSTTEQAPMLRPFSQPPDWAGSR